MARPIHTPDHSQNSSFSASTSQEAFSAALTTFQEVAKRVPAYKKFLKKNSIDPKSIKTAEDFATLPPITKQNYLAEYSLADLMWDGDINAAEIISTSSGSSGKPFFWFRGSESMEHSVTIHDRILGETFKTKEKNTLFIVAFAMGTWIGGTYTLRALQELKKQRHKITIISPGINKQEVVYILKNLSGQFDQTIIGGYPPFVKDILDEAHNEKINLEELSLKLLFAGESFSEEWRDYVLAHIGNPDPATHTATIYGTADAGALAHENPFSIYVRRLAFDHEDLFTALFPDAHNLPCIFEYDPLLRYFETDGNELLFTVNNSMPLIRYKILDFGHLVSGLDLAETLKKLGYSLPAELQTLAHKPYIILKGRSDIASTFYALKIYPENIKRGLEQKDLQPFITGKFVLRTHFDEAQQQSLHLYIELKKDIFAQPDISEAILATVVANMRKYNSEYNRLYQEIGILANPAIHLLPFESSEFTIKIKSQWIAPS